MTVKHLEIISKPSWRRRPLPLGMEQEPAAGLAAVWVWAEQRPAWQSCGCGQSTGRAVAELPEDAAQAAGGKAEAGSAVLGVCAAPRTAWGLLRDPAGPWGRAWILESVSFDWVSSLTARQQETALGFRFHTYEDNVMLPISKGMERPSGQGPEL